jgi:serine O-acetyltransferase
MSNNAFIDALWEEHNSTSKCASPEEVAAWFNLVIAVLFPGVSSRSFNSKTEIELEVKNIEDQLVHLLKCNAYDCNAAEEVAQEFKEFLPTLKSKLDKDAQALLDGDPAAKVKNEVVRSYPGFYATAAHRVANFLWKKSVSLIPRMISEYAHTRTGVDIHPGATIGEYFFIDHGTGVVIGETSIIGNNVKIYQGVTLGALSVEKRMSDEKRHPTVEDNVVIYAGATILGGKTIIGAGSVIGGNVWLTRSVPAESKIYYKASMTDGGGTSDTIVYKP